MKQSAGTRNLLALGLGVGGIVAVLDTTLTIVATPALANDFDVPLSTAQWATTAYILGYISTLPLAAWLSERFGAKRAYIAVLALFCLATVVTAAATGPAMLTLARAVQGLGGGPLNPLAMTILLRGQPSERRGRTASTLALPMLVAPLLGPIVGGTLIDSVSWRVVFLLVIPPALLAILAVARWAPADRSAGRAPLSLAGLSLLVPGSAGIVYAASAQGIGPSLRAAVIVAGVLALATFAVQSLHSRHPLLRLELLADRRLAAGLVVLTCFAAAYFGSAVLTPTYVQITRNDPATIAAVLGVPAGLATAVTLQVATRLVDRFPPRWIVVTGLALAAVAFASTRAVLDTRTSYVLIGALAVVLGIGSGAVLMPAMTASTRHLDGSDLASGSVLTVLVQQLASATGTAAVAGLFSSLSTLKESAADLVAAHRSTLLLPLGLTVAAAVVAATTLDNTKLLPKDNGRLHETHEYPNDR